MPDLAHKAVGLLLERLDEDACNLPRDQRAPVRRLTAGYHLIQRESTRR
ncbi:hypothetical protein [Bifidobacterium callitrichos]|nr:hypothetical protein [Bifidobacterium callitrichos]